MNAPPERRLHVRLEQHTIGELSEFGDVWRFRYTDEWLQAGDGFDLSPSLPRAAGEIVDGGSTRPVQWFFDNLLPEEDARRLLADQAHVDQADAFALLECFGSESAGALTLLPDGVTAGSGLRALDDEQLSARIRALPRVSLAAAAPKRMSMAGAQHKLAVVLDDGRLFEPIGATPSTHLLKPDHVDIERYPHTVANEWFCMTVAHAAGLRTPAVALRRVPEPVYLVERFDRVPGGEGVRRLHALDACQLLSLSRLWKYRMANAETMTQLIGHCRQKADTRRRLFSWYLFNLLIGNGDAHLKNLSFLISARGIALAPHYDLLSTAVYADAGRWLDVDLSWPHGETARLGAVTRSSVLAFAAAISVPPAMAAGELDRQRDVLPTAMDKALRDAEQAGLLPGELRLLRTIRHGVLTDLVRATR